MKKAAVFFTAFMAISAVLVAQTQLSQDIKVTAGTPYKVVDAKVKEYFFDGKESTISVKKEGEKVIIQKVNVISLVETSHKEYIDFPLEFRHINVVKIGGKLHFIYAVLNRKELSDYVYAREINMSDVVFKPAKLLFKTSRPVAVSEFYNASSLINIRSAYYDVFTSFDKSKLMFRYRLELLDRNDDVSFDQIGFQVFDENLEKQWGGELKMPFTEKQINNLAYGVGKNGTVQMLIYQNDTKKLEMVTVKSDLSFKINKINIEQNPITATLFLREDAEGNYSCTGYYANELKTKLNGKVDLTEPVNSNGLLWFKVNSEGEFLDYKLHEFSIELINQYEDIYDVKQNNENELKGKAGLEDLYITDVVSNTDGSVTIVGEQCNFNDNAQYINSSYNGNGQSNSQIIFKDVIVARIDKSGNMVWIKKLPKHQYGETRRGGMGIKYMQGLDSDYIFFIDKPKNVGLPLTESPYTYTEGKEGYITLYKISNATGVFKAHTIVSYENINGLEPSKFTPSKIFMTLDKVFMFEVYIKGKQDVMIKMELKD